LNSLIPILLLLTLGAISTQAQNLVYATDFEEFDVGVGEWLNQDHWLGNDSACVGIDDNIVSGLGKTAYLGFAMPQKRKTVVLRRTPINPQDEEIDSISFRTLLGVQDSTNFRRDVFSFSVYNRLGKPLAGIRFDNRNASYGIWRYDGTTLVPTGVSFLRGEVYDLRFTISYADNTWSALFDGLPLFTDQPFHNSDEHLDFLGVAAEWIVGAETPDQYGNNWLLIGDWQVTTSSPLKDRLVFVQDSITKTIRTAQGLSYSSSSSSSSSSSEQRPKIRWQARANGRYFIESTTSLGGEWQVDGDSGVVKAGHLFELNLDLPTEGNKYYRLRRSSPQVEVIVP